MNQNYGKITVRFAMTKCDGGAFPDYSNWPKKKRTRAYLASVMKFCPEFDQVEDSIASWKIIEDGLSGLSFTSTTLSGYPTPIVEFVLNEEVEADEFLFGVSGSSYMLNIPGFNSGDSFYYEDHNGYSEIISIEQNPKLPGKSKITGDPKKPVSALTKRIEANKSFNKRSLLLATANPTPTGSELLNCLNLVCEKAKNSGHFAQIAYLCEKLKCADLAVIQKCAAHATRHPTEAGLVVRAFFANKHIKEGKKHWSAMVKFYKDTNSYYAQILAFGLLYKETKAVAKAKIAEFLNSGPAARKYESLTIAPPPPNFIFHLNRSASYEF